MSVDPTPAPSKADPGAPATLQRIADELIARNVHAVAELELTAQQDRSPAERVVDAITSFFGSLRFVVITAVVCAAWIGFNLFAPEELRFDPFPFGILTLIASAGAIFLTAFVLMTQNRTAQLADRRHHLNLQIGLLAEQEVTKILELVQGIHARLGLGPQDPEIEALKQITEPRRVAEHLDRYVESASRTDAGDESRTRE